MDPCDQYTVNSGYNLLLTENLAVHFDDELLQGFREVWKWWVPSKVLAFVRLYPIRRIVESLMTKTIVNLFSK